jgi:hypothetical protein
MAPDDESGSGSPLAELLTAATAHFAGSSRIIALESGARGEAGPLHSRPANVPSERLTRPRPVGPRPSPPIPATAWYGVHRSRWSNAEGRLQDTEPRNGSARGTHRHGGTAEQHHRQRPRGTPPHQRRRRQRALRRFRIARTRATPRFKISDRARAALAPQRLGLPAAFSGTSQDRLRSAPCPQPRRRQTPR